MPELWLPQSGVNRKQKELWLPQGGVSRKQKELYAPSGGANRKIFSGGIGYNISVSEDDHGSDWGAATFSFSSDAAGRMYAYVSNSGSMWITFTMVFTFDSPILKSYINGSPFMLDFSYERDGYTYHGAQKQSAQCNLIYSGYQFDGSPLSKVYTASYDIAKENSDKSGNGRIDDRVTRLPEIMWSIKTITFTVEMKLNSTSAKQGNMEITWNTNDIWLINKWINNRYGDIQI